MAAKGKILPQKLPPTVAAAREHSLRAYLQYRDWILLETQSLPPIEYGWRKGNDKSWEPIPSSGNIAPESLLKLICCNCTASGSACATNICSCRKFGFKWLSACGESHGLSCNNSRVMDNDENDDDDDDDDDDEEDDIL